MITAVWKKCIAVLGKRNVLTQNQRFFINARYFIEFENYKTTDEKTN